MSQKLDISPLIAAAGGLLLFISLFLHWYQPALSAWTVFEVWDLVLAVLAVVVVWLALAHVFMDGPLGERSLAVLGAAAFVIVVSQIVNHPPAAQGASPQIGAWVALFGSALMVAGGALRWGGLSLHLNLSTAATGRGDRDRPAPPPRPPHTTTASASASRRPTSSASASSCEAASAGPITATCTRRLSVALLRSRTRI